jgi:hypothetical protein
MERSGEDARCPLHKETEKDHRNVGKRAVASSYRNYNTALMWNNAQYLFVQKLQDRVQAGRAVSCSYTNYRIVLMRHNALYPVQTQTTGSCWCGTTRCILFRQKLQDRVDAAQRSVSCSDTNYRIMLMRDALRSLYNQTNYMGYHDADFRRSQTAHASNKVDIRGRLHSGWTSCARSQCFLFRCVEQTTGYSARTRSIVSQSVCLSVSLSQTQLATTHIATGFTQFP